MSFMRSLIIVSASGLTLFAIVFMIFAWVRRFHVYLQARSESDPVTEVSTHTDLTENPIKTNAA